MLLKGFHQWLEDHLILFGFIFASIFFLSTGIYIRFHVTLNDFWGVLYYAKHMAFSQPASLYNGFFPFGYAFLLSRIPYGYVTYFAFAVNIVLGALLVMWTCGLFYTIRKSIWIVGLMFVLTLISPLVFEYSNTLGPDIGLAAFSIGGAYFLWRVEFDERAKDQPYLQDLLAGLCLGLAGSWRTHGFISSAIILSTYTLFMGIRRLWSRKLVAVVFALTVLIQVSVNLISGHGPFETAQNFTAYIAFYGMNWWHIPPEVYTFSLVNHILADPVGSFKVYLPLFLNLVVYGVPAVFCAFITKDGKIKKYSWFVAVSILLYSLLVAFGTSATERGPMPILGLSITILGLLAFEIWNLISAFSNVSKLVQTVVVLLAALGIIWASSGWIGQNLDFLDLYRHQDEIFILVEDTMISKGMKSPNEVFTNKNDFYFPYFPPYRPVVNGGWQDYSMWGYRQEYPELPTDSWEAFVTACRRQKIKFLVLSPGASLVADFLQGLYDGNFHPSEAVLVAQRSNIKIYKIAAGD